LSLEHWTIVHLDFFVSRSDQSIDFGQEATCSYPGWQHSKACAVFASGPGMGGLEQPRVNFTTLMDPHCTLIWTQSWDAAFPSQSDDYMKQEFPTVLLEPTECYDETLSDADVCGGKFKSLTSEIKLAPAVYDVHDEKVSMTQVRGVIDCGTFINPVIEVNIQTSRHPV